MVYIFFFAYIDGGHLYEVAWKDFKNVARHLLPNGFIYLNDLAEYIFLGNANMAKRDFT